MADRETWNERYRSKELVWSAGPNQRFAELVADLPPGRALDLGCGEGRNALWLAEQGWDVTAVDYASEGIAKARQLAAHRGGVHLDLQVADAASIELPQGAFDLVAVIFLHTGPAERAHWLPASARAVRAGGHFVYIGHDPANIEDGVGGPQDPAVLPSADVVTDALEGFRIIQAGVVERTVGEDPGHGEDRTGVALDTVVFAQRLPAH